MVKAGLPFANLVPGQLGTLGEVVGKLGWSETARLFGRNAASINHYYIVYVNLADLAPAPPKNLGASALQLVDPDEFYALYDRVASLAGDDRWELMSRLLFYKSGFQNCHTMKANGAIAYLQWLILPADNPLIEKSYKRKFLRLNSKEVMIENSFTFPEYRGRGFLPFGTWHLLNSAKELGYKRAVAYVRKDRIDALNQLIHVGFNIKRMVREYKFLGFSWRTL
jgi:hypothetical protein